MIFSSDNVNTYGDPQRIGGQADRSSFVYAIEQLREFRWQHATNDDDAIQYINKVAEAHECENAELRRACTQLRWMLGADRCIRCDMVCEDRGRCPLDEWLESLGVTVPEQREVGHVSQCKEEDEQG